MLTAQVAPAGSGLLQPRGTPGSDKGVKQPSGQEGMGKVGDKGVTRGGWRAVTGPEFERQPGPPASSISSRTVGRVGT